MQQRRGTAAQWTAANPILASGEIGFETDTNKFKIGDGTNTWSLLKYFYTLDEALLEELDINVDGFIKDDNKGIANGVASLDSNAMIPVNQLPNYHISDTIDERIAYLVGAAPETLNTLNELAEAIGNNADYADTMTAALSLKASLESPTFTGTVSAPTADSTDNSTKVATTAFVQGKVAVLSGNLDTVGSDITTLQASVETINSTISVVESDIEALQTNDGSLSSSIDGLDSRLDAAEATITANSSSISTLQTTTGAIETDLTALDARVVVTESDITQIDATLTDVASDISTLQADANTTANDLTSIHTDITTLQTNTTTISGDVEDLDTRVTAAEADIVSLQSDANTATGHASATTNVHGIADTAALATTSYVDSAIGNTENYVDTELALKADLASPALTGTPTAPTASVGTDTTQLATTAFVQDAIEAVIGAAPAALDTLNELAAAINDDASYAATVTSELALKAPLASPTFTGTVALPAASSVTLDGTALSATLADKADKSATINTMSGSHTAVSADLGNVREMSGGGTFTIPSDNSFWPVGGTVDVLQTGSSQVTIAGGSGVTVNATPGLKLRTQWSSATILKRSANTFVVMGDLSA